MKPYQAGDGTMYLLSQLDSQCATLQTWAIFNAMTAKILDFNKVQRVVQNSHEVYPFDPWQLL